MCKSFYALNVCAICDMLPLKEWESDLANTTNDGTYTQVVTSWRAGLRLRHRKSDFEIMFSSQLREHGMTFGLPEVEPLVWNIEKISSPLHGPSSGGNAISITGSVDNEVAVCVGTGESDREQVVAWSTIKAAAWPSAMSS
jgi:hypothetical protein